MGRQTRVAQTVGATTTDTANFTYNAAGELATVQRYNANNAALDLSTYTYDNAGRLTNLAHTLGTVNPTNHGTYTFDYDAVGRILRKTYLAPGVVLEVNTFSYDS